MKIIKTKKGMGLQDAFLLLYRIILVTIAVGIFAMFVNMVLAPFPNINVAKSEILTGRLLYSEAIHVKDNYTGTINTNIIDIDKLLNKQNNSKLQSYFRDQFYHPKRTNLFVFNLTLYYIENNQSVINSFVSNSTQFKLLNPKKNFKGKGAVTGTEKQFATQCKVNNTIIPCSMSFIFLIPNS